MEIIKSDISLDVIKNSAEAVVLTISSQWCPPCKALTPVLEKLSDTLKTKNIKFLKIDVSEDVPDYVRDMKIKSVPTILFFFKGELKEMKSGFCTDSEILNTLKLIGAAL